MKTKHKINDRPCVLRIFPVAVPAGFPSPADDYLDTELDLQEYLVAHPAATFLHVIEGHSMEGAGIMHGDIVVVDRSINPKHGRIVVAILHGEKTIKRLVRAGGGGYALHSEPIPEKRGEYPAFPVNEAHPFEIWGTVVGVVRRYTG